MSTKWPSEFGTPLLDGYTSQDDSPLLRTQMESGPDRVALLKTHYMTTGSASLLLDKTNSDRMRFFIKLGIKHGSEWINDMPLDTGNGLVTRRARLTNFQQRVVVPGKLWRWSFGYETDER